MNRIAYLGIAAAIFIPCVGADDCSGSKSSDTVQREQQERILQEGTSSVGMPAITNFREKRLMKQILEQRDQSSFITHTYLFSEVTGKLTPFCDSIGYPIPYATQYTNPLKPVYTSGASGIATIAQADPNGLFSPGSADGTWVMCKDPHGTDVKPVYVEPKVVASPYVLPTN